MANNLCYFEFMVSDPEKSRKFYTDVFDWKVTEDGTMPGYLSIDPGKEPAGGMMKKPDQAPHYALSVYFHVDSIDETLKKAEAAGAKPGFPRTEIPKYGWWAMFFDPDGIAVMLFEAKK